jgi:squalene-hopene/tetraprenyl-beta-curcumene cyclase
MTMSSPPPDSARVRAAYDKVCQTLFDRRTSERHWIGRLSDSALSTATAVSALTIHNADEHQTLIRQGVGWLLAHQNLDGGWGDTDKSFSNISTTLLVKSALHLAMETADGRRQTAAERADEYLQKAGGIDAIRKRYGNDQTFSVPILTNAALAGLVDWKEIPQLPFELAALPMSWFRFVKMNVVSYAVPALVAIGQVRFHFFQDKGRFIGNFFRHLVKKRTLRLIQDMQPASGGYLEAAPLTSFVVMSLSAMGLRDHPIVANGIRFLLDTVREDGSWAIDTNLATWVTSLSMLALHDNNEQTIDWLLSCQHTRRHPFTGASPGGWGWTNLSGAVPDADDTSAALLALALPLND